jgi:hypothetical protein
MEDSRFDALTRRLITLAHPRRGLLAFIAGSGVGVLLEATLRKGAAARDKYPRRQRRVAQRKPTDGPIRGQPPGPRLACKFAGQKCGSMRVRRNGRTTRSFVRCCGEGAICGHVLPDGSTVRVGPSQRGKCLCDLCYDDADGDGICRLTPPPPCVALNGACSAYGDCCDPGASVGAAICIGDICTGRGFCPPASLACAVVKAQKGSTQCDALPEGTPQCCKLQSIPCANDCQCCGSLRCENGTCVPCVADGIACPAGCAANAECHLCCAGFCRIDGKCGPPQGCVEYGGVCTRSSDCCNDVPCTGPFPDDGTPKRCRYP